MSREQTRLPFLGSIGTLMEGMAEITSESSLIALALALGARSVGEWHRDEVAIAKGAGRVSAGVEERVRAEIQAGGDPLGDLFCALRTPVERRESGATYTPKLIVDAMTRWALANVKPGRVVDAGAGSGRFLVAAGRTFKKADLLGVELDPLAAILARGHLAASGLGNRARVLLTDYRELNLEESKAPTLFIGNPPYVRHHRIAPEWKQWLTLRAAEHGLMASQLAGLHVYFFLATARLTKPGDAGVFISAAEWLDVNYGKLVRDLFLNGLGGEAIHLIEPAALPFADAATTAVITCFKAGSKAKSVFVRTVADSDGLGVLAGGRPVRRERLQAARRWTPLMRAPRRLPAGYIELGELCTVHRGQVTGANRIWIEGAHSRDLPSSALFASITKARDLFRAGRELADASTLRRVIDLPADLNVFEGAERKAVDRFLKIARGMGGDRGYIAEHRKVWWSIGLRSPAPILTTYMARRAPAFVLNSAEARHINIAHGINCSVNPAANEYVGKDFNDASLKISCTAGRTALEGVSGTRIPASVHPYEVGGRGALPDMAEYMGSGGKQAQFWTTQDGYDWIFDKLAPPAPAASLLAGEAGPMERRIEVFGLIRQSAAVPADVTMEPWWSFTDNTPRRDTKGIYTIAAVSGLGVELSSTAIRPNFDPPGPKGLPSEHVDPAPFEGTLGFPEGTVKFVISRDGKPVREIPVSANAPVIKSVAPQTRGTQNGSVTITWDATDADGDALAYEVEYNPDVTNPSLDWEVLRRDLTDQQFTVDFSRLAGGAHAYMRISATDGINATEADSAEFVVPPKAPTVFIDQPLAQARFLVNHEIVLRGDADDLQDNEVPNARLQWSRARWELAQFSRFLVSPLEPT